MTELESWFPLWKERARKFVDGEKRDISTRREDVKMVEKKGWVLGG